jgi:hypothetical protein
VRNENMTMRRNDELRIKFDKISDGWHMIRFFSFSLRLNYYSLASIHATMSQSSGDSNKNDKNNTGRNQLNRAKSKSSSLISSLLNNLQKASLPQIPQFNSITEADLLKKKGSIGPDDILKLRKYTESMGSKFFTSDVSQ